MSAQLNRLQAFLADAGELEIVAPSASTRPDYFGRFARLLGATLVASHVSAVAAAPVPAHEPAPAPAVATTAPEARDRDMTQSAILSIKQVSARYLAHGRSPLKPQIRMLNPDDDPLAGPMATVAPEDICRVEGVRTDYSKSDPRLARMADTPQMRTMVLVHESMHCRLAPALFRHLAQSTSAMAYNFAVTFSESSADAIAILTLARHDGLPLALNTLDRLAAIRASEAASPDSDGHHDSRETLARIRAILVESPQRLNSDGATFSLAITEALMGTSATFKASLPAERAGYMETQEFRADMTSFHQAVEEMARDYLGGAYELGAPEITFNNLTLPAGQAAEPTGWQLLAKKIVGPAFTAAGLRAEAEVITAAVIAAAGDAPSHTAVASADGQPQPTNTLLAVGRLRSRLDSIYVDPQGQHSSEHEQTEFEEPARPQ